MKYPDVIIGGLLADQGGDRADEAAEFNVEDIVDRLAGVAADAKGNVARGFDGDADQPRLRSWGDKRKLCLRSGWEKI